MAEAKLCPRLSSMMDSCGHGGDWGKRETVGVTASGDRKVEGGTDALTLSDARLG